MIRNHPQTLFAVLRRVGRIRQIAAAAVLLALAGVATAAEPPASVLRLADGTSRTARLVAADTDWTLQFTTSEDDQPLSITAADVIAWGAPHEPAPGEQFLLADGGVLVADLEGMDAGVANVDSKPLGELKLPMARVRAIVFRPPGTGSERDQFLRKARQAQAKSDQVWMSNGDTLDGTVVRISGDSIHLRQGDRTVKLPIDNAAAIVFDFALVTPTKHAGLHAVVGLADGSRLVADQCVFSKDRPQAEIRSADISVKTDVAKIVFLQPRGGRATYLSDLKPAKYRHIPLLDLKWDYQTDANVLGGRLRCRDRLYLKGIGVHSASVLTYRVPTGTKRLVGRIGVDDSAASGGSVIFRVFVDDGSGKWKPAFASKVIRGSDPAQDLSIDLTGARQISLMVDFADRGDVLDHADWLDVAFVK